MCNKLLTIICNLYQLALCVLDFYHVDCYRVYFITITLARTPFTKPLWFPLLTHSSSHEYEQYGTRESYVQCRWAKFVASRRGIHHTPWASPSVGSVSDLVMHTFIHNLVFKLSSSHWQYTRLIYAEKWLLPLVGYAFMSNESSDQPSAPNTKWTGNGEYIKKVISGINQRL